MGTLRSAIAEKTWKASVSGSEAIGRITLDIADTTLGALLTHQSVNVL